MRRNRTRSNLSDSSQVALLAASLKRHESQNGRINNVVYDKRIDSAPPIPLQTRRSTLKEPWKASKISGIHSVYTHGRALAWDRSATACTLVLPVPSLDKKGGRRLRSCMVARRCRQTLETNQCEFLCSASSVRFSKDGVVSACICRRWTVSIKQASWSRSCIIGNST